MQYSIKATLLATANALKNNQLVIYPTDTIWGLGCNALSKNAVNALFNLKQRPPHKSMIILVNSITMLKQYVTNIPSNAYKLINTHNSPLTLIYPQARNLPAKLIAPNGSIAIRMVTNNPFINQLLNLVNKPIVATSANFSNHPTPKCFSEINPILLKKVAHVAKYSTFVENEQANPSAIIKLEANNNWKKIR